MLPSGNMADVMPRKNSAIPLVIGAAVVFLLAWFVVANSHRRVEEVVATIEAITTQPGTDRQGQSERTAMILMPDGRRLYARLAIREAVDVGQKAKIAVIEEVLSGTRTYEVFEVIGAARTR